MGPIIGIPNIRSLYRRDIIRSEAILSATNSEPNVELSTVFCLLECQTIGAELIYSNMPVCDLLVILLPAWSESTKQFTWTGRPLGSGAFGGTSSFASK